MRRDLTPDGGIAILETDEFHHILLTWPIDLVVACSVRFSADVVGDIRQLAGSIACFE